MRFNIWFKSTDLIEIISTSDKLTIHINTILKIIKWLYENEMTLLKGESINF